MELHEEIGRGGMGVVYRARQTNLDRTVAVKVLLGARFAGEEERERFHREAKAAAKLDHPGIVRMFDIGEEDGMPWFSMEHVPGENMEQALRHPGHPDPRQAAESVAALADAVAHAHTRGILHRDLKPSNVLIDESGRPRITDFGIARLAGLGEDAAGLTQSGQMLGSPGYASPEQALFGRADPRTDVYGLGAILYHLLTGRPPFTGPTLESVLLQLRENEPIAPRAFHPPLHRDLETICLKCLRKNPPSRYESASDLAADLRRYLQRKPILARPPGRWERTGRWIASHPAVAVLVVFVILLAGGLVAASLWYVRDKARSEHRSSLLAEARTLRESRLAGARTSALLKLQAAWQIRPSAEILNECIAALALADLEFAGKQLPIVADSGSLPDEFPSLELDPLSAITRDRKSNRIIARFPLPGPCACAAAGESGEVLAFAAPESGELRLLAADGTLLRIFQHPLPVEDIAMSGELIATSCANRFIYIWDKQGNLKHRLSGHDSPGIRIAFRPRSQILASTAGDTNVRLWHAARGEELLRLEHSHPIHQQLQWSADGLHLIGTAENGHQDVYRMPGQEIVTIFSPPQEEPHSENLGSADLSADGRFAIAIDEATGRVWDLDRGQLIHSFPKQTGQWLGAKFHPSKPVLFTCGWAEPLRAWTKDPAAPGGFLPSQPAVLLDEQGHLLRAISADGRFLALSNNAVSTYTVVHADGKKIATIPQSAVLACAIAPDGSWLATSSYNRPGLRVWSLPEGKLLAELCQGETIMQALALGPDRLVTKSSARLRVFATDHWSELPAPPEALKLRSLASTLDGKWLAGLGDHDLRIVDTRRFSEVFRLTPPRHAGWLGECHVCFDAAGDFLFVQTALATVMRWDLRAIRRELDAMGMNPR
jgi:predicted Ser/Thr protein kinase